MVSAEAFQSGAPDPSSAGRGGKVDDGDDDEAGSEGFESPDEFEDARSVLSDVSSAPLDTRAAAGTPPASDDLAAADDERASSRGTASGTTRAPAGEGRPTVQGLRPVGDRNPRQRPR